jgi:DNA-binding CsgD family transcriptional regulator
MPESFQYDVFLSHSSKDKAVVRPLAEQLRKDGLRVWFDEWEIKIGDSIPAKVEEGLERSRVLILCMSAHAFGSNWATLESQTFRFRDPLNKGRRFIPLRLDEGPLKGSLAQFRYVNWLPTEREQEYQKLIEACLPPAKATEGDASVAGEHFTDKVIQLDHTVPITAYAFSPDGKRVLTGGLDMRLRLWDAETGARPRSLSSLRGPGSLRDPILFIEWSDDQRRALVGTKRKVRLLDLETDRVIADFGSSSISKRQMDCFRFLAGGFSALDIRDSLHLHEITVGTHLTRLRIQLGLARRKDVRTMTTRVYGRDAHAEYPSLRAHSIWIYT